MMSSEEEEEEEVLYCICRKGDVNRFMIGCDHCEEWYHGDCIGVTAKEAKYIKKFYCKECKEKNGHLAVVYKSKYADKVQEIEKEKEKTKLIKEFKDSMQVKLKEKDKDKEKEREKDKDRENYKEKEREKEKKPKEKKKDRDRSRSREKHKEKHRNKDKHNSSREKHKHKHKDKDREREKNSKLNEEESKALLVFETKCLDVKIKEEKEKYKPSEIKIEDKAKDVKIKEEIKSEEKGKEDKFKIKKVKDEEAIEREKRIEAAQVKRLEEIKREKSSLDITDKRPKDESATSTKKILQEREKDNILRLSSEDEWQPLATLPAIKPLKEKPLSVKRKISKDTSDSVSKKRRTWRANNYSSDEDDSVDLTPRHCYGMDCINSARVGSKYCSDQCGLSLASLRIYQTLPERIREWNLTNCKSAETNQKELVRIRSELQTVRERLEEVDREVVQVEAVIAKSKNLAPMENNPEDSSDEEDEQRGGGQVNCISCGKDVPSRTAIRHMESCFNKMESLTSFGSSYKTNIEGYQMFCDFYNPQAETYCKRLRVICPEHTKDHKISDTEVCGYPLNKNIFTPNGEFCRLRKKVCNAHFCWEKLRRAELDMDRVRQWLKLDELMEQERAEKESLSRRAGVLNLMLHSTFNHEIMEKVMKMQGKPPQGGQHKSSIKRV